MNITDTTCPVIATTIELMNEFIVAGGENRRIEFARQVLWIQESETTLEFRHGGQVIKTAGTYTDWYGYLTSMRIGECRPDIVAANYRVTPDSSLEIVLHTKVFMDPVFETDETRAENARREKDYGPWKYRRRYAVIPDKWRTTRDDPDTGDKVFPMLVRRELGDGITWTSKNTPEQNAALLAEFKARWEAPAYNPTTGDSPQ